MHRAGFRYPLVALALLGLASCEQTRSENPLSPSVAGPIAGVSIEAPRPHTPPGSAQIPVDAQPITLTVDNASSNGIRPISYLFEVAAAADFTTKVFEQSGVEPGKDGRTSLRLPISLAPERTYFWRAKADDGANASVYSAIRSFKIYTPVVIQPPVLRDPADGATVQTRRPTLSVVNARRTGPAGEVEYLFEVATSTAFATKVVSVVVAEAATQTNYTVGVELAYATRYYWRVKASDPGHESPYSAIRAFLTPEAPIVPPRDTPPGRDHINMSAARIMNSPQDLASWPITTALTMVDLTRNGVHPEFHKADGPGRWPDVFPPGWDEPLQFTLGMCLFISGQWYCSAPIQFWHGLWASGGPPEQFAENWFYAADRWGPMAGHQPAVGETIGFFVCAGNCRNNTSGSNSVVKERSNVVLLPFPGAPGGTFRF